MKNIIKFNGKLYTQLEGTRHTIQGEIIEVVAVDGTVMKSATELVKGIILKVSNWPDVDTTESLDDFVERTMAEVILSDRQAIRKKCAEVARKQAEKESESWKGPCNDIAKAIDEMEL